MEVSPVCRCEQCVENLRNVQVEYYQRRTRFDIVFEKCIEHTDAEIKVQRSAEMCPKLLLMVAPRVDRCRSALLQKAAGRRELRLPQMPRI